MAGLVKGAAQRKGQTQVWESVASGSLGSRDGTHNRPHMPGSLLPTARPAMPLCPGEQGRALWESESLLGQPGGLREELGPSHVFKGLGRPCGKSCRGGRWPGPAVAVWLRSGCWFFGVEVVGSSSLQVGFLQVRPAGALWLWLQRVGSCCRGSSTGLRGSVVKARGLS